MERDSIKEQANQREKKKKRDTQERYNKEKKRSMNGVKTGFWSRRYSLAVRACFENKNKGIMKKENETVGEKIGSSM